MSTVTFHNGLGPLGSVLSLIDHTQLMLGGAPTLSTLTDPSGYRIVIAGDNFWFSAGTPSWTIFSGHLTGLQVYDPSNTLLFEVTDADADGRAVSDWILAGNDINSGQNGGPGQLWGTDALVFGSDEAEKIVTGAGNDTVDGGAGRDELQSDGGDDVFTGGAGHDFFFAPLSGSLIITDFDDDGPKATQDDIVLRRKAYLGMVIEQDGNDAILTLNDRHGERMVILQDYDSTQLDRTDFTLFF